MIVGQRGRIWLRRLLPWVITTAVVAALISQYSLEHVIREMSQGRLWPVLACATGTVVAQLVLVGIWDTMLLRAALGPVRYRETIAGKAATSMLVTVGYGAGQGAYGVWIARKTSADIRTTIGMMMYIGLADVTALAMTASVALWATEPQISAGLQQGLRIGVPLGAAGLLVVGLAGPRILGAWVREARLLKPWSAVPAPVYLGSVLGRAGSFLVFVVATWGAAAGFGMQVPLPVFLSLMPVIVVVGALPINVAGFGAVQAAWLLLSGWATGERILAFQFLWQLALTVALVARGAPFLPGVLAEMGVRRARPAQAQASSSAS